MELRRFNNLSEAEARYWSLANERREVVDELFLALCRGEDERAQSLYRQATFPSRWWADVVYMQGHYLIRLRRRDRIIELAERLGVDTGLSKTTDDPWADICSMAQALETCSRAPAAGPKAALVHCLHGHVCLAMDFHELANAAYRAALELDRSTWVPWENTRLFESLREECVGDENGMDESA